VDVEAQADPGAQQSQEVAQPQPAQVSRQPAQRQAGEGRRPQPARHIVRQIVGLVAHPDQRPAHLVRHPVGVGRQVADRRPGAQAADGPRRAPGDLRRVVTQRLLGQQQIDVLAVGVLAPGVRPPAARLQQLHDRQPHIRIGLSMEQPPGRQSDARAISIRHSL